MNNQNTKKKLPGFTFLLQTSNGMVITSTYYELTLLLLIDKVTKTTYHVVNK